MVMSFARGVRKLNKKGKIMNQLKIVVCAVVTAAVAAMPPLFAEEVAPVAKVESKAVIDSSLKEEPKKEKVRKARNRNLSIVIDRSASLGSGVFDKSKEKAIKSVEELSANDFISLVAFGEQVEVLSASRLATDEVKKDVIEKIKSVKQDKKAAMFAGIAKGADELRKNLDKGYENKIELFSSHERKNKIGPSTDEELSHLVESLSKEKIKVAGMARGGNGRGPRRLDESRGPRRLDENNNRAQGRRRRNKK
jgi:Ca-activated chloride channel family protein